MFATLLLNTVVTSPANEIYPKKPSIFVIFIILKNFKMLFLSS